MTARVRRAASIAGCVVAGWCSGCAMALGPFVTYGREEGVVGYRVVYVEATPKPGSPVPEGQLQAFSVTVNYMLTAREKGILALEFTDRQGHPILDDKAISVPITRTTMRPATLRQEVRVPRGLLDVVVRIGVVPEGEHRPGGWLQVRYPTTESR